MAKELKDIGHRANVYMPLDMKEMYLKLNKELKKEGTCISQLVQQLILDECRTRGIK